LKRLPIIDPWNRKHDFKLKKGVKFRNEPGVYWLSSEEYAAAKFKSPVYYIGKTDKGLHWRLKGKMHSDFKNPKYSKTDKWPKSLTFYKQYRTKVYYLSKKKFGMPFVDLELVMLAAFNFKNKDLPEGNNRRREDAEKLCKNILYADDLKLIGENFF